MSTTTTKTTTTKPAEKQQHQKKQTTVTTTTKAKKKGKKKGKKWQKSTAVVAGLPKQEVLIHQEEETASLMLAQAQLAKTMKNPFTTQLPPLGSCSSTCIPVSGTMMDSAPLGALYSHILFVLAPAFKAGVGLYVSTAGTNNFTFARNCDVSNLTAMTTEIAKARVGAAAMQVMVRTNRNAATPAPVLYVGTIRAAQTITATLSPNTILGYRDTKVLPGQSATVVWKPADLMNSLETWSVLPLTTGMTSTVETLPFILLTDVSNIGFTRMNAIIQGEGLPTAAMLDYASKIGGMGTTYTVNQLYADLPKELIFYPRTLMGTGSTIASLRHDGRHHVAATTSHPTEASWVNEASGALYDEAIRYAKQYAWDIGKGMINLVTVPDEVMYELVLLDGLTTVLSASTITRLLSDPQFRRKIPLPNLEWFDLNLAPPPVEPQQPKEPKVHQKLCHITGEPPTTGDSKHDGDEQNECVSCSAIVSKPGYCSECALFAQQTRSVRDNAGVQSIDTTPEDIRRKLDVVKFELTGKAPPARDLLRAGISTSKPVLNS